MTHNPPELDRGSIHAAYEAVAARLVDLGDPDTAETARQLHRAYRAEVEHFTAVRTALMPTAGPAAAALATAGSSRATRR